MKRLIRVFSVTIVMALGLVRTTSADGPVFEIRMVLLEDLNGVEGVRLVLEEERQAPDAQGAEARESPPEAEPANEEP